MKLGNRSSALEAVVLVLSGCALHRTSLGEVHSVLEQSSGGGEFLFLTKAVQRWRLAEYGIKEVVAFETSASYCYGLRRLVKLLGDCWL